MPRPIVSKKNTYYIPKERYYELLHFCRQFNTWVKAYDAIDSLAKRPDNLDISVKSGQPSDPTEKAVETKMLLHNRMCMISAAMSFAMVDIFQGCLPDSQREKVRDWMYANVTEGMSYDQLSAGNVPPISRDEFYKFRRAFFWFLSDIRN